MANRWFNQFQGALEKGVVKLFAYVVWKGTTLDATITRGKGIASVARSADGVFVVHLQDKFYSLLGVNVAFYKHDAIPNCVNFCVRHVDVNTADPTITIGTLGGTNGMTATIPEANSEGYIEITLSNSSAL